MRKKNTIFIFFLLTIVTSLALNASEGGEHHFDWTAFLGKALNSSILIGVFIYFLRKPIIDMLSKKSIEIKDDIVVRESELKDHRSSLAGIQTRLDKIEDEVGSMIDEARKNGEIEAERIKELAELESERIIRNNREEIDARIESSVIELKKKIADMTIEEFRNNYRSILNMDLHKKIIDKNIEISGDIIEKG
ncbi:MAG: ATP synthase F0 subunit B [Acidobacteriota bacterium]